MPAPAARMRSAMVPCGTHSSSILPSRHSRSNTTGSAVRGNEQTILRTRPVSSSLAKPTYPTPELLATTVRSLAPCSIKPSISAFGWPMLPKPPTRTTAPSRTPAMASAMVCTILLIIGLRSQSPGAAHLGAVGEVRHHLAGEAAQAVAGVTDQAAAVEQYILDAELAQIIQLHRDLVGIAIERALFARLAGVGIGHDAGGVLHARRARNRLEAALRLHAPLQCSFLVGGILGHIEGAGDTDIDRVEHAAVLLQRRLVDGDALGDGFERGKLIEQQVIAARRNLADRVRAAGAHPDRRMRLLRGRRLDDDVLEIPIFAVMREALLRRPGFHDDIERLVETRIGFRDRHAEAGKLIVPVALAGAEIEPAARKQIDGRGLLGKQHRI